MSLLVLTPRYVPLYSGGATQEHRVLRALAAQGLPTRVVTLAWPGLSHREILDGIPVIRVGSPSRLGRARFALACIAATIRGPRSGRVVVAMAGGWGIWLGLWAARRVGCPSVLRLSLEGADDPVAIRRQRLGSFKLRLLKSARRVLCLTPALAESCRAAGIPDDRILLLPNAVDLETHRPPTREEKIDLRRRLAIPEGQPVAVFLGALTERKGILDLLDLWKAVAREQPRSLLLLCGPAAVEESPSLDPEYLERVRARVEEAELRDRVRITGLLDETSVLEHLRVSDLYVSMSRAEGLANALLEAMAVGLPVLTFSGAKSLEGVVSHGREGWIVEPGDSSRYLQTLRSVLGDRRVREAAGRAGRRTIEERFALDVKIATYRETLVGLGAGG